MSEHFFNNVRELALHMATLKPDEEQGVVEALNITFIADSGNCIGTSSEEYRQAELNWFLSRDNSIDGLKIFNGKIPKIWQDIADWDGIVNSNYGYRCLAPENGVEGLSQFELAMKQLILDKNSRRGIMVYNFPQIHGAAAAKRDYNEEFFCTIPDPDRVVELGERREQFKNLKTDFMCCQNSIFSIEGNKLMMSNMMRSLDLRFGLPHDWEWWNWVFDRAVETLKPYYPELERGDMYVSAVSAHVYRRHWKLLDKFKLPDTEKSLEEEMMLRDLQRRAREVRSTTTTTTPTNGNPFTVKAEASNSIINKDGSQIVSIPTCAYNEDTDAGKHAYFGSPSNAVHGGGNLVVDGIHISGDSRYQASTVEHWDVEGRHNWGYKLGCASKYIYRNRFKGQQAADLKKALKYVKKFVDGKLDAIDNGGFIHTKSPVLFTEGELDGLTEPELIAVKTIEGLAVVSRELDFSMLLELFNKAVKAIEEGDDLIVMGEFSKRVMLEEIISGESDI